jgi:hypothetical protein
LHDLSVGLPDLTGAAPPVYANVAHASFTPYDFRITFSLLTFPDDRVPAPGADSGVMSLTPRAVAQVVLPAASIDSVVDLLRTELDRFVEEFGAPQPTVMRARGRT